MMAIDDDGSEEAVGAEKNPRKGRRFVWALLSGAVLLLIAVLLYLHFHTPLVQP
jgi:hypothetical protein